MDRKEFIKTCSGLCAVMGSGFLMSAVAAACKVPLGVIKTTANNNVVTIPLEQFAQTDYKIIRVSNYHYDLAIQKKADGQFYTLVLKCTHAGQPVTKTGNTYYCTLHGSQFSHEGKVMKGPAEQDMLQLHTQVSNNNIIIKLVPII